jgi:NitT/TauT family transport system substrate-binding protein
VFVFRRTFLGTAVGAGLYSASACGRPRAASVLDKVRVSLRPTLYMAPFYLAQESGYFSDASLQLELLPVEEGAQSITLLAGGKLDVAFGALPASLPSAVTQGAKVRVVAGRRRMTSDCSDTGALYGNRAKFPRGLARLTDLKQELRGKQVAINSRSNSAEFYLETLLSKAGLTEDDLHITAIRFSEAVAAVINGHVDALLAPEQFSAQTIAQNPQLVRGIGVAQVLPGFQFTYVFFGKNLLSDEGEIGFRFLQAFLKGVHDFARGRTPKFLDDFARSNGYDLERARQSCRDSETPDGSIDRESIGLLTEWFVRKGYCPQGVTVNQIIDTRFVERIGKQHG